MSHPKNMYPDRRECTPPPLSSLTEKTFEHQSSLLSAVLELLYSGLRRFKKRPLFGKNFSSNFWVKMGFQTCVLHIIFNINHACPAET